MVRKDLAGDEFAREFGSSWNEPQSTHLYLFAGTLTKLPHAPKSAMF
jgi:hypothetical protein